MLLCIITNYMYVYISSCRWKKEIKNIVWTNSCAQKLQQCMYEMKVLFLGVPGVRLAVEAEIVSREAPEVRLVGRRGERGGASRGSASSSSAGALPLRPRHGCGTAHPGRARRDVLLHRRPEVRVRQPVDDRVVDY